MAMKPYRCRACYVERATVLCRECRAPLCDKHSYIRVDGNNRSITKHAPILCAACYEKEYKEKP